MKKYLLLVFFILLGIFFSIKTFTGSSANPTPPPETKNVSESIELVIDYGDENSISFNETGNGESVFDLLINSLEKNNIPYSVKEYDFGKMVEKIGEKNSDKNHFWVYSVNDVPAEVSADNHIPNSGDKVLWKYTEAGI